VPPMALPRVLTVSKSRRTVDLDTEAMDPLTGLVFLLAGAAIVRFVFSPSTERVLDSFAAGFMPYRAANGWPRGVQEEEPVAWSWSSGDGRTPPSSGGEADMALPELIDIDADDAPTAIRVSGRSMARGMARRRS
jgi:hypothetical protein